MNIFVTGVNYKKRSLDMVSCGDSGIYGMAGLMLEIVNNSGTEVEVEIITE